jgi:flagellar hook-length control protein FliK
MQSLLQQIKADGTKESSAGMAQKSDKVALIAELIRKVIPEAQTASKGSETVSSSKETLISTQLSQLRPDILQALSKKPLGSDALNLNTSDILKTVISKTDSISFDDKKLERMTQLVDLLKPLKTDEPQLRTQSIDKPIPTSIPATQTTPSGLTAKADLPTLDIQPSLQSKAWNQVLSSRVVWMATEGLQQAALKLNPANLGPVEVRLRVQNEQVNVTFIAQNPATRDALEQALPRLRESFVENGMALTHADVSDQASQQAREDETQKNNSDNQGSQNGDITTVSTAEQNSDKTVTNVEQNNEAGVNVYA